jgi:cell volume regulation protein A
MTLIEINQFIFVGAGLALLCVVASLLSRRFGAPILLVFLILGMLAGENGPGGIMFSDYNLAFLLGSLALAIIILDGGLGARKDTFRVSLKPALSLATLGVLLTAGITGLAVHWLFELPWLEAFLIGAIVGSTDAAAVFGLLRFAKLDLPERTGATLEIESGTNDPMAIFLTVTLVQLLALKQDNPGGAMLLEFAQQMGLGIVLGLAGGKALVWLLGRMPLTASLYPLFVLAGGLSVFGATNHVGGSGFLAIYIVGVVIGNSPVPYSSDIHRFHDGIAWLSQIGMFVMLGLLVTPSHLPPIILPAIAIALVLIFIARPLAVVISLLPFRFPWRQQVFISWCGLRGAVPIILALFPSLAGLENTNTFFELVFFVVLISLVLQGWTIAPLARWLKIELPKLAKEPEHKSLLVVPEHEKSLHIYEVLQGCRACFMRSAELPLSEGAQFAGVIREGVYMKASRAQKLEPHDQVVILSSGDTSVFGAIFAPVSPTDHSQSMAFFGEFVISPNALLVDLAEVYPFTVPEAYRHFTVADFVDKKFHHKPVVGDRVVLESVMFVVREMKDLQIISVGLKLKRTKPAA